MTEKQAKCKHPELSCLNHWEQFRKYICNDCKGVFICNCEKEILLNLFSYQSTVGTEFGTNKKYKVHGFLDKICSKCKGESEEPHPKAAIYNLKKKYERFYWREINISLYKLSLNYIKENNLKVSSYIDFQNNNYELVKQFEKQAKDYWKNQHKKNPLYDTEEANQNEFLSKIPIPVETVKGLYKKIDDKGRWIISGEIETTPEGFIADHYKTKGCEVYHCERNIVSTLVGSFLWKPINDDSDVKPAYIGIRGRRSKFDISKLDNNGMMFFSKAPDFGTKEYFNRLESSFASWIDHLGKNGSLVNQYDTLLDVSYDWREYLWVNNDDAETITRAFLAVASKEIVLRIIRWAIEDFWNRQPGWPDLLIVKDKEYFFAEVKTKHDRLSLEQMNWFKWAYRNKIPCKIIKLERSK